LSLLALILIFSFYFVAQFLYNVAIQQRQKVKRSVAFWRPTEIALLGVAIF